MLVESTNISRPLCVMMHVLVVENEAISFLLSSDTAAVLEAFLFEHETRKDIAPLSAMGCFRYLNASIVWSFSCYSSVSQLSLSISLCTTMLDVSRTVFPKRRHRVLKVFAVCLYWSHPNGGHVSDRKLLMKVYPYSLTMVVSFEVEHKLR